MSYFYNYSYCNYYNKKVSILPKYRSIFSETITMSQVSMKTLKIYEWYHVYHFNAGERLIQYDYIDWMKFDVLYNLWY